MNYPIIKQAMRNSGYPVAPGDDTWCADDACNFRAFAYFVLGVPENLAESIIMYPAHHPQEWFTLKNLAETYELPPENEPQITEPPVLESSEEISEEEPEPTAPPSIPTSVPTTTPEEDTESTETDDQEQTQDDSTPPQDDAVDEDEDA